jgi:hypothetical protein
MKSFEEYCLVEMARPAKSFVSIDLNQAYATSLKKFKAIGIDNANTYHIWDFIFRLLPDFFKQEQFIAAKKKHGGTALRTFVRDLLMNHMDKIDSHKLAIDMNDESKIRAYIDRPDKGNRHIGRVNVDAQHIINNLSPQRSSSLS